MTRELPQSAAAERRLLQEQQVILDNAGVGISFVRDRLIQRCNRQFALIYGYDSPEQLAGRSSQLLYPDALSFRQLGVKAYPRMLRGEHFTTELQMVRRDGSRFWCRITGNLINPQQPEQGSIWIIDDIDHQRRADEALQALHREQQLILDHAMVGIAFLRQDRITRCNQRLADMLGYDIDQIGQLGTRTFYPSEAAWQALVQDKRDTLTRGEVFNAEVELVRRDGTPLWCELCSKAIDPGDPDQGSIWIVMDISRRKAYEQELMRTQAQLEQRVAERTRELETAVTKLHREIDERRMAEERIRHLARHDSLTGLPNRSLFEQRLARQLQQCSRDGRQLAVLFIDLDRFKHINDSLGHHEGDMLLRSLAERLRQALDPHDTLARIGGDEFVALLTRVEPHERIEQLLHRLQSALQPNLQIGLQAFSVTASIGVSLYPHDGPDGQTLIMHAETAMYRAKRNGRNRYHFYNHQIDRETVERIELRHALYQALHRQEFELHYQPQVSIADGRIVGVEALIRWQRPQRGWISPACFIPLAEECGLINEIGHWVLETACAQLGQWQQAGLDLRVAVNLSAAQLDEPDFYDRLEACLRRHRLAPQQLELELTESTLMKQVDQSIDLLNRLDRLGVHLSIDDFGTGYSSLSYLKRFPLNTLKIDRSFVQDLCNDPDDAVICRTIISMAKTLNLTVTAEGVEHSEQLTRLAEFGCQLYQGYLFSRPRPADEITRLCLDYQPPDSGQYAI